MATLFSVVPSMPGRGLDLEIVESVVILDFIEVMNLHRGIGQNSAVPGHLSMLENVAIPPSKRVARLPDVDVAIVPTAASYLPLVLSRHALNVPE